MKKTAAKNLKLIIVSTLMVCATGAVYSGLNNIHNDKQGAAAASKPGCRSSCCESDTEDIPTNQFVVFRIMQLL